MKDYDIKQRLGEFGRLSPDKFDETYLQLIKSDIDSAQTFLKKIPDGARRGLTPETLKHFHCGWLDDWLNTKNAAEWICGKRIGEDGKPKPLAPPSRRVIVPTPNLTHFNAIVPPADRKPDDNWCKVHAGTKSLFYDHKSLKAMDIVFVVEGEFDAMSIWQATAGKSTAVATLGRNGWRKCLLPKLKDLLKGKNFIVMYDKDDAQEDSKNLCDALIKQAVPAIGKFIYDYLTDEDKKIFGNKVDANDLLVKRGDTFLRDILRKIYADARKDLKDVETKIEGQNLFNQTVSNQTTPTANNDNSDKAAEVRKILKFIPANKLDREKWIQVGIIMKRYGLDFAEFDKWSQDDSRYDAAECKSQWNSFWNGNEHSSEGFKVATLVTIAKQFGYDQHGKHQNQPAPVTATTLNPELEKQIEEWQQENGAIDPKLLPKLKAEAQRISATTDFASAKETTTLRFLGAFQYYTCFKDIADKFFADYKRAFTAAKKRIRDYDKAQNGEQFYFMAKGASAPVDVQTKPPSDSDIALSLLTPSQLQKNTVQYITAARKAHNTYLIQKQADEIIAQREAEEENYYLDPDTTKKNLPDCPIDLVLPRGVYFSDKGISIVDFDAPAKSRVTKSACENPIVPVRAFREVTENGAEPKQGNQYEIAIKTQDDWVYTTVEAQKLTDPRSVSSLAKYGALISSPTFFAKAMTKIIAQNERNGILKSIRVFTKPGWHGDEFIYPTGGDDYIVSNGSFNYKNVFTPRGDKKKWLKMIKRALFHDPKNYDPTRHISVDSSGNETVITPETNTANISGTPNINFAFVLGFCAAAPLVHILGIRNPQGVFGLDSGNGKTAAASLAVSLFGKVKKGLMSRLNATANYLEDNAVNLNDFPQVIDELQSAGKKRRDFDLDTMIYDYADGITRGRADITGKGRPTEEYRGCRFFTGEQTIIRENSGQGAVSRIFEIKKEEIFADPFAIEIHKFVADNYGFFGREFTTEFIPNNRELIKAEFLEKEKFFGTGASDLLSSHATIFAFAFTGLKFLLEFLQFQNVDEIILDSIVAAQELIDDAPTKSGASNVNRALPALLDYFDKFPKNFIREVKNNGVKEYVSAEGNATFGVKLLDGSYAIIPSVLRKIISDDLDLPNASAIIRGLGKKGYLEFGNAKKQDFKKRLSEEFNEWYGKVAWFYVFKPADILLESIAA